MDHVDSFAIPVIAKMAALQRPGDDVGPEGGDTFAARIANRGIDDPVAPGIALPAREILRRRIIVGGEKRVEAARPDVDEHGLHGADQFAHVRGPARFVAGVEQAPGLVVGDRSEEHTSELQSLMRISYAVFCLKKKKANANLNKMNT